MMAFLSLFWTVVPWYLIGFAAFMPAFLPQCRFAGASPLSQTDLAVASPPDLKFALDTPHLSKRAVPSTREILALIDRNPDFTLGAKPSIFWTGLYNAQPPGRPYFKAKRWAEAKFGCERFNMYDDVLTDADYRSLNSEGPSEADNILLINRSSRAFALRTRGTAYVMMDDGAEPSDTSVWKLWEAPTLTRQRGAVTEIIRVGYPSLTEQSIWKDTDPPLYEPAPIGKL